jgi:hypothetical protein
MYCPIGSYRYTGYNVIRCQYKMYCRTARAKNLAYIPL